MSRRLLLLWLSVIVVALGACAGQTIRKASALSDAQRNECANLRAQNVDLNQAAITPDYCKGEAGVSWSSEPEDPMKLELGHDEKGD